MAHTLSQECDAPILMTVHGDPPIPQWTRNSSPSHQSNVGTRSSMSRRAPATERPREARPDDGFLPVLPRRACGRLRASRQSGHFSRLRGTVQQGPVQRQETQIVQSCMTLDDFLPGFGPPVLRWANTHKTAAEAVEVIAYLVATERALAALKPAGNPESDAR